MYVKLIHFATQHKLKKIINQLYTNKKCNIYSYIKKCLGKKKKRKKITSGSYISSKEEPRMTW